MKKRMKIKAINNSNDRIIEDFIEKIKMIELLNFGSVMLVKIEEIVDNKMKIIEEEMGCSLEDINIERNDESLSNVIMRLVNGLENLHSVGIIHGNIKPNNILCNKDGKYKYDDYLINRMRDINEAMLNNIKYMNYELLSNKEQTSYSDTFNLGLIFHKIISGYDLLNGKSIKEIYSMIVDEKSALVSAESTFQSLIEKMLDKDKKIGLNEVRMELEEIMKKDIKLDEKICELNRPIDFYENNGMLMTLLPFLSICGDKNKYFYEILDTAKKYDNLDWEERRFYTSNRLKYISYLVNFIWNNNGSYIYKKICHKELDLSEDGYESHESTDASMIRGAYNNFTLVFYGSNNDDNYSDLAKQFRYLTSMKRLFLLNENLNMEIVNSLSVLCNLEYLEIDDCMYIRNPFTERSVASQLVGLRRKRKSIKFGYYVSRFVRRYDEDDEDDEDDDEGNTMNVNSTNPIQFGYNLSNKESNTLNGNSTSKISFFRFFSNNN